MANFLFSFLVLSIAINIGFVWKFMCEDGQKPLTWSCRGLPKPCVRSSAPSPSSSMKAAQVSKTARVLSPPSSETTSSAYSSSSTAAADGGGSVVINLDHGDPTMYEKFWKENGEETMVVTSGWQYISYFSDVNNICWFLEPELASSIRRLHKVVRNAVVEDRHIVVGTGSSQLFQAVLYALSPPNASEPMSVVSAAPFYSSYPLMTDYLRSGLHKWAGDANKFDKEKPYIELVTSPNNPDGSTRQAVVNGHKGILVHDLAYYWPQYTPILFPADYDIMLFTVSKSTGHAGSRIGWALVKDREIAKKMTAFMEINTIGVSKDSQIRAAKILQAVSKSCDDAKNQEEAETFFDYSYKILENRWKKLREAVNRTELFSLPDFPVETCSFSGRTFGQLPAFAWLKCEGEVTDCESFLRVHKILTRGGKHFGVSPKHVRISMLSRDREFKIFTERLPALNS